MSASCDLQILSWNVAHDGDYWEVAKRGGYSPWKTIDELPENRNRLFRAFFNGQEADILCLQEVGTDLARVENWLGPRYRCVHDGYNAAIAWKVAQFSPMEESPMTPSYSRFGGYLIYNLKHRSGVHLRVASAHIKGFDLANPDELDGGTPCARKGDLELEEVTERLFQKAGPKPDLFAIGLDGNSTPNIHPERIKILEKRGMKRSPIDETVTAYNPTLPFGAAKIDYIFVKVRSGLKFDFKPGSEQNLALPLEKPETNPSDHSPVYSLINLKNSFISIKHLNINNKID